MSSLLDSFRTMFSPSEAKALFTENMSSQEKLKIRSAIEAIDAPKRKDVFEVTQSIVWGRYCPTGREKIVSAVAAKNLSVDEWRTISHQASYAHNGLNHGEDLAKILLAVAALSPEKRTYCDKASYLFEETMPVEDRVLILNAFAAIRSPKELDEARGMLRGLKTGREIALVLTAAGKTEDKHDLILYFAARKIDNSMSSEKRVEVLEEAELSGWYSRLDSKAMTTGERIQLKRVIEAFPDKSVQIDFIASRFVTEPMTFHDRLLILSTLAAIPSEERKDICDHIQNLGLISDTMSAEDRINVLNAVRAIRPQEREAVCICARDLIAHSMTAAEKLRMLNAVIALPPQERVIITTCAGELINHNMNADGRIAILNALAALPSQNLEAYHNAAIELVDRGMNAEAKVKILNAIAVILPQDLEAFTNIVKTLITPTMNAEDRTSIVNAVAAIPPQERLSTSNCSNRLIEYNMNAEDRVRILNAVAAIPSQDLEAIYNSASRLIDRNMNAVDKVLVLNAFAALTPENRISIVIQNRFEMSAAALVALINDPIARHAHNAQYCARHLLSPAMNDEERALVLNAVIALPHEDMEDITSNTNRFITDATTAQDRVLVLNAIAALSPENRRGIFIRNRHEMSAAALITLINDPEARDTHNSGPQVYEAPPAPGGRRREGGMTNAEFQRIEQEFDGGAAAVIYNANGMFGHENRRFCVDLSKLSQNPTEVLSKLSEYVKTYHAFPSIRFWDAEEGLTRGVDAGGLTRDFITKLFQALSKKVDDERTLLPTKDQGALVVPLVDSRSSISVDAQVKHYELIGYLYAHALKSSDANKIKTGPLYHPAVFEMIHALSADDISRIPPNLSKVGDVPQDIYEKQLKLYLKSQCPQYFPPDALDAAIEAFVTHGTVTEQMKAIWPKDDDDPAAVDVTKEEVMPSVGFDKAILPVLIIGRSMKENGADWDAIRAKSPADLEDGIQGRLTKEIAIAAIRDDNENLNEAKQRKKDFLIKYIEESTFEELEKLCYAACGSRVLPPVKISSSNAGPGFHTCFRSIDLPVCANFEEFKPLLSAAVDLAQAGDYSQG